MSYIQAFNHLDNQKVGFMCSKNIFFNFVFQDGKYHLKKTNLEVRILRRMGLSAKSTREPTSCKAFD